jgi:hypothetical protein
VIDSSQLDIAFDEGRAAFREVGDYWPGDPIGEARARCPYGRLTIANFVWRQGFDCEMKETTFFVHPFGMRSRRGPHLRSPTETMPYLDQRSWWRRLWEGVPHPFGGTR